MTSYEARDVPIKWVRRRLQLIVFLDSAISEHLVSGIAYAEDDSLAKALQKSTGVLAAENLSADAEGTLSESLQSFMATSHGSVITIA